MKLSTFLAQAARTPFAWGRFDCLLWAADWALANGHADPGARFRGRYATALGCQRLVRRHGGLVETASLGCADVGLAAIPLADIQPGDVGVGVVGRTDWGEHLTGLIRTGVGWAALGQRSGLLIGQAEPKLAWRIACPR